MPMRVVRGATAVVRHPQFWPIMQIMATFFAIAVASYLVWLWSTESSARAARQERENLLQVTECFDANRNGPAAIRFLDALETILRNQVRGSTSSLRTLPPNQASRRVVLKKIIAEAKISLADVEEFEVRQRETTPTMESCNALAKKLGVDIAEDSKTD